jgi:hypothetical protein
VAIWRTSNSDETGNQKVERTNRMSGKTALLCMGLLGLGVLIGGYLFSGVQSRPVLALTECADNCFRPTELAGLLASAGIKHAPGLMPLVVKESGKCISINHPYRRGKLHVVMLPKRDIRDIANIAAGDEPYVLECFSHIRALVSQHGLHNYQVLTNGPGFQHVTYLHFHLIAK